VIGAWSGRRPLVSRQTPEAQGLLDDLSKPSGVRPPPVDPSAGQTGEKGVVVEPCFGREPVEDLLFRDGREPSVAGQAAREGRGLRALSLPAAHRGV
jgi:hypothetical protein